MTKSASLLRRSLTAQPHTPNGTHRMQHRINERAINSALARVLTDEAHLNVISEATSPGSGGEAPDLRVQPHHGQFRWVSIEAKVGTGTSQRRAAIADAVSRLTSNANAYAAIALCYPDDIARRANNSAMARALRSSSELEFVEVSEDGPTGEWYRGDWRNLATAIVYAGDAVASRLVQDVDRSIVRAVANLSREDRKRMALALDLPGDSIKPPTNGGAMKELEADREYVKAAKIGCMLIINGMVLQSRLFDANVFLERGLPVPSLELCVVRSGVELKEKLTEIWHIIHGIDYHPIYNAAIQALDAFPGGKLGAESLRELASAAGKVIMSSPDIRSDLAGRIYHRLLDTAPFDGSYYTSTPAAILLARLALTSNSVDWSDLNEIAKLRVCDPACGTGTLLLAVAQICRERNLVSNGGGDSNELMQLSMVEDVLRGMDINLSAVHLAASMLALSDPRVDFGKMGIYRAKFGVERNGGAKGCKAWLGSLELLRGNEPRLPFPDFQRASDNGAEDEYPDLHGKCDLVIMNPPFTRDSLRHDQLGSEDEAELKKAEGALLEQLGSSWFTDRTSISPMFTLLADELCKFRGSTFAKVMPSTAGTNTSGLQERIFYNERWQVETVITSHDPKRIYFSENTDITESLMIARRRESGQEPQPTRFINLAINPASAFEALTLAADAERGDFANWGTVYWNSAEHMAAGDWLPMLFYNGELTDAARSLRNGCEGRLSPLGEMASLAPGGRSVRAAFRRVRVRQSPDMRALWEHKTSERTTMAAEPDSFIAPKVGEESAAAARWAHASRLLIANRFRCNLTRITSALCDTPVLGSAWESVTPNDFSLDPDTIAAAWCMWANSSAGILSMLAIRQRDFTYPRFSMDGLRSLPFPDPDAVPESITALASAYDALAESTLLPLPQAHECATRVAIDSAVADALGPDLADIHKWRDLISHEPNVCNRPAEVATT